MASAAPRRICLTSQAEFTSYSHDSTHDCWAVVNITAPSWNPELRAPVDIVAVIDTSESMEGEKLDLIKTTLLFVMNQLNNCDRFSLITYDAKPQVKFGLLRMTKENKMKVKSNIESLEVGTCTNLYGGLMKGMEEIVYGSGPYKAPVQSVLLLTDGLANKGMSSKEKIVQGMMEIQDPCCNNKEYFQGTVYTFGFGFEHDADMLEAISTQGGGTYYYIDRNEKISESFADCLGGLLSVVGKNLQLQLDTVGEHYLHEVYANHETNWITPHKRCEITLGDLQSEEQKDIILHFVLSASPRRQEENILKASLCCLNVISSTVEIITTVLDVNRTDRGKDELNTSVQLQKNRILVASALKEAKILGDQGDFHKAELVLNNIISKLEHSTIHQCTLSKSLLMDLKASIRSLKSCDEYISHGRQYILGRVQSHITQRSNFIEYHCCYSSTAKEACRQSSKEFCACKI